MEGIVGVRNILALADNLEQLVEDFSRLVAEGDCLTARLQRANTRKKISVRLASAAEKLRLLSEQIDDVAAPLSCYSPNDITTKTFQIALQLVKSQRQSLCSLKPFYGSGIYALYYTGRLGLYGLLSGSETPIYIGKADPAVPSDNVREQGTKIYERLKNHRRSLELVQLPLQDFEFRAVAVGDGAQLHVEKALIDFYRPLWNGGSGPVSGFGKHGDNAKTRANAKSTWDTLHRGRPWAEHSVEAISRSDIVSKIEAHLVKNSPYHNHLDICDKLLGALRSEAEL